MNIQDLIKQKEDLERQIAEATSVARGEALTKIKELMAQYGLTISDLAANSNHAAPRASATRESGVAPKFRHPSTGETWAGRGRMPKWCKDWVDQGRKLEDCLIGKPAEPATATATDAQTPAEPATTGDSDSAAEPAAGAQEAA